MRAKLDSFFHDIGYRLKIANDTKKLLDKRLASSFSLFHYIAPNENLISKIIRDLLDPNGNHGQGDIFLQKFLETIGKPELYESGDQAFIRTEECTTNIENNKRRIDILIEIKRNNQHHTGIAIENKPWAADQHKKIDDYLDHIRKKHPNYYIIYLTQNGDEPSDHSAIKTKTEEKEKLITMSYKGDITVWLEACHKESQAEYVRQFLLDFSNYCHQPNLNHKNMQNTEIESKSIIDYIIKEKSTENFKLANMIQENFKKIHNEMAKKVIPVFSRNLTKSIKNTFHDYNSHITLEEYPSYGTGIYISKDTWLFNIALQNEEKNAGFFGFGVFLKSGNISENKELRDLIFPALKNDYSRSKDNRFCNDLVFFTPCAENEFRYWEIPNNLIVLSESPEIVINYITDEFRKILAIVEPLIDKHPRVLTTCQPAG